ncbi:hypothetical protein FDP25_14595 [Roseovarius sp. A21]|uniref:Uncharacterized protein n=1 Tax=Roseovarius bejariae TaxID=2576383 RepID=A0A844CPA2_9RHOB|nr:hypothetical protein [Roseovarius bejariae]MRU16667.1 hypothetical protein [Roseovarius bejariae]
MPDHRNLVKLAGHFSLVLAVDDFFLIHDRYIAEGIIIPLYAIFVIYLLVRHRGTILSVDGFAFFLAGGLLFMSVLVDAVQELMPVSYGLSQTFEEGFKFMDGAAWLYFCTRMAAYRLQVAPDHAD